jgi:hypothetical protein
MAPVSPPLGWTCYSDALRHSGNPAAPSATKTLVTRQWWKEALVTTYTYEIRVNGSVSPAAREAFADMVVDVGPTTTVLSGDLDQAGLQALLDRIRALGLELVDIKRPPPRPPG